jgi:metal-responsive CopG/Arc/MetJ family transcriptional regulator
MSNATTPVLIRLAAELLTEIDDWRYAHRVPSRAQAIRRLIERGLSNQAPEEPRKWVALDD